MNIVGDMGQSLEFAQDHEEDELVDAGEEIELDQIREVIRSGPSNDPDAGGSRSLVAGE